MSFPLSPVNLQEYTNSLGTTYQYIAADTKWIIKTQNIGLTGLQGETGLQGVTGLIGATGIQGVTGIQGSNGTSGGTGLQGTTGLQGSTGSMGETGAQGITGLVGPTGIQGLIGETGSQGVTGLTGETGSQGITGLAGETGIQGVTGAQGQTGLQGVTGVNGVTGLRGLTGLAGIPSDPINFTVYDNGNSSTAIQIELFRGQKQKVTISNNATLRVGATGISGAGTYTLKMAYSGNYTVGWTGVRWSGATIPYHSSYTGMEDIVNIYYDGTAFYGVGAIGFAYP